VKTSSNPTIISITGANGFIGKNLVNALSKYSNISLRLLVRSPLDNKKLAPNITQIQGDLTKPETLKSFLVPGCIVINLAYNFGATSDQNITAAKNLIETCQNGKIKRLIHCSTAAVFGRTDRNIVDESTVCNPRTEYGRTKLLIEKMIHAGSEGRFEFVNTRPKEVYGPGGQALKKLINNLVNGNNLVNYLRSCLFNVRVLNLVHVSNVVAAIIFFVETDNAIDGETYIISEDFDPINNYKYVEAYLLGRLTNRRYLISPVQLPLMILSLFLRLLGRDSSDPRIQYNAEKIKNIGFEYVVPLNSGLDELIEWYQK